MCVYIYIYGQLFVRGAHIYSAYTQTFPCVYIYNVSGEKSVSNSGGTRSSSLEGSDSSDFYCPTGPIYFSFFFRSRQFSAHLLYGLMNFWEYIRAHELFIYSSVGPSVIVSRSFVRPDVLLCVNAHFFARSGPLIFHRRYILMRMYSREI